MRISISIMAKFRKQDIEAACVSAALCLGYKTSKNTYVITHFVSGSDVFAILPTGFGKSLCYACLPGVLDRLSGMTYSIMEVLTPLTATMKDQIRSILADVIQEIVIMTIMRFHLNKSI